MWVVGLFLAGLQSAPFATQSLTPTNPMEASFVTIPIARVSKGGSPTGMIRDRLEDKKDHVNEDDEEFLGLLQNVKSLQYVGPLFFGTRYQKFDCIYDTGSSNTWAYTTECKSEACRRHNRFDVGSMSSEKEITIEYGSGTIKGDLFSGPVSFEACGGSCESTPSCHCSPNADWIGVTDTIGEAFEYGEFNCIIGLGHPKLAMDGTQTTLQTIQNNGRLKRNMFSFYLTKRHDAGGSRFLIGDPDQSLFRGSIYYYPLYYPGDSRPSYWTVKMVDIVLKYDDGREVHTGVCGIEGCQLALDSGTSLVTGPSGPVYDLIDKADVEEDCSNFHQLPRLGLVLDQPRMTFWLNPSSYVYKEKEDGKDICIGSFYPLDIPRKRNFWIAGDTFLSSYYSVYDASCWNGSGECRVGLAARSTDPLGHDDIPTAQRPT